MASTSAPYRSGAAPAGQRHEVEVNGAPTRYWSYGPEHARRTIVMVHGFRGDHHGLEPLVSHLLPPTGPGAYRVLVPDLPGFGASGAFPSGVHSVPAYAGWLTAFVTLTAAEDSVLLGHSFGSVVVAAALAGGQPADRAVLVNPIGDSALSGPHPLLSRLAVCYYRVAAALPERVGDGLLRSPLVVRALSSLLSTSRHRPRRRWIVGQHLRYFSVFADRQTVLEAFEASVGDDVSRYAPHVQAKVLLIGGDRDDITSASVHPRLRALFPSAELVMIAGVGHLIHYEAPAVAARAIDSFLDTEPAGRSPGWVA